MRLESNGEVLNRMKMDENVVAEGIHYLPRSVRLGELLRSWVYDQPIWKNLGVGDDDHLFFRDGTWIVRPSSQPERSARDIEDLSKASI